VMALCPSASINPAVPRTVPARVTSDAICERIHSVDVVEQSDTVEKLFWRVAGTDSVKIFSSVSED
jgi:hypothetical protein